MRGVSLIEIIEPGRYQEDDDFTLYNFILLGCRNTTALVDDSIIAEPRLKFIRKEFKTIVWTNNLELGKKDLSASRIDSGDYCVELTIY